MYKVTEYKYVGGSYGKCSEDGIIEEVRSKGPIVVSFEPDYQFMFYSSGIYSSSNSSWISKNLTKPEWEKVDHSVVLVGWGAETNEKGEENKYWVLQNSWGKAWGESGYFKMKRGTDFLGIESICEAGDIILVK